mgnify:CR=1 FL=1|tara:strand:- start:354 stop:2735 length:2382 start_codon:yes stop_codon:yes gene_type:complete
MNRRLIFVFFSIWSFVSYSQTFIEDFEDLNGLNDWYFLNNSDSPEEIWGSGNTDNFNAYDGATFLGVGYESSNSLDPVILSNWAVSPSRTFNNGDIITFYSRRINFTPVFPDRLEVRMSTAGNSIYTGFSSEDTGDFSTLLLSINPDLTSTGYPSEWTQYTIIISGLNAPTNGRIAFRYFVPNGGPGGSNSNYIGIDSFTYYSSLTGPENDDCETAIEIDHAATCTTETGSIQVATESLPGCSGTANNDVWYSFTATTNAASIEILGSSELDAVVEIYSGTCANLNSLACVNNGYEGDEEATINNNLVIGSSYHVRIYDWNDWVPNTMDFTICVEAFEQCAISPGINSTIEAEFCGENENGGCFALAPSYQDVTCNESVYGSCNAQNGIKDYDWYRFTINDPGTLNIMENSEFPITLEVFNIANCNVPQLVTSGSFNACEQNTLTANLPSGTYALAVSPTSTSALSCDGLNHYEINFGLPNSNIILNVTSDTLTVCEGDELYITSNQTSGAFSWILNNENVSTQDSLAVVASGLLFLDYTNNNACSSNYSDSLYIILNSTNEAIFDYGSTIFCIGDGFIGNNNSENGYYIGESGLSLDTITGTINTNLSEQGTYTIIHHTTGNCPDSVSIELSIGTYSPVVFELSDEILCDTSVEMNLEALPSGGFFDGIGIDGNIFYPSISGVGTHQISYSYNNEGCISSEVQEITVENCSSLLELKHDFKIWPNPFQDKIQIELPNNTKYCLINIQGQMVTQGFSESSGIVELNLANIDNGIYYVILESNLKRSTIPIVKR